MLNLDMCLTLGSSVSRFVPLCGFEYIHFQLQSVTYIVALQNGCLRSELKTNLFYPPIDGTTLKPSSPKLSTCQGQNCLTLVYWTSVRNRVFGMYVPLHMILTKPMHQLYRRSIKISSQITFAHHNITSTYMMVFFHRMRLRLQKLK